MGILDEEWHLIGHGHIAKETLSFFVRNDLYCHFESIFFFYTIVKCCMYIAYTSFISYDRLADTIYFFD